jgi:hypothetical protein
MNDIIVKEDVDMEDYGEEDFIDEQIINYKD